MFYAALFHFAAGVVAGSAYRVYVLLALLVLVAVESGVALVIYGSGEGWWALANPALLQMGYLVGAFGRGLYEASPYSHRAMRPRRMSMKAIGSIAELGDPPRIEQGSSGRDDLE